MVVAGRVYDAHICESILSQKPDNTIEVAVYADNLEVAAADVAVLPCVEGATGMWARAFKLEVAKLKSWSRAIYDRSGLHNLVRTPVALAKRDLGAGMSYSARRSTALQQARSGNFVAVCDRIMALAVPCFLRAQAALIQALLGVVFGCELTCASTTVLQKLRSQVVRAILGKHVCFAAPEVVVALAVGPACDPEVAMIFRTVCANLDLGERMPEHNMLDQHVLEEGLRSPTGPRGFEAGLSLVELGFE